MQKKPPSGHKASRNAQPPMYCDAPGSYFGLWKKLAMLQQLFVPLDFSLYRVQCCDLLKNKPQQHILYAVHLHELSGGKKIYKCKSQPQTLS